MLVYLLLRFSLVWTKSLLNELYIAIVMDEKEELKLIETLEKESPDGILLHFPTYETLPDKWKKRCTKRRYIEVMGNLYKPKQSISERKRELLEIIHRKETIHQIEEQREYAKRQMELQEEIVESTKKQVQLQDEMKIISQKSHLLNWTHILVIVLLGLFGIYNAVITTQISVTNAQIADAQKVLMAQSNIPNYAELAIKIQNPDLDFISWQIADINYSQHLNLWLINKGRLPTGPINLKLNTPWLKETRGYIENIESGGSGYRELQLTNTSTIPFGNQTITLLVDCAFCKEELKEIPISIKII